MAGFVIAVLVLLTASSGAIFKPGPWYETLNKPSWTPPDWAFPTVWTILYIMIGYAGWLIWTSTGLGVAMVLWCAQLVLNALWSYFFFGRQRMDQAFTDVILLWLSIVAFIIVAWPISQTASLLFVPYLVWVTTAAKLNHTVWKLNPGEHPVQS